jgi:hypothetical protein
MKTFSMLLSLLGFALTTPMAHADAVYTCANNRGDTLMIKFTPDGQRMALRSLYVGMKFTQSKRRIGDHPDYTVFQGQYPTGNGYAEGIVSVQSRLLRGSISGSITLESDDYNCKAGAGKLKVSRETREEFGPPRERGEPCKLTTYYNGMTFIPPRVVCDYGSGFTVITGGGRSF